MKLSTKTAIYFLGAMLMVICMTGYYLFRQFNQQISQRDDKELLDDELQWISYLSTEAENNTAFSLHAREISIYPTAAPPQDFPVITDAGEYGIESGIRVRYRELKQVVSTGGISYQIDIKKSQEQKLALIKNFSRIMLIILAGLLVASIIFNWVISRKLWQPFRRSLQKIRSADLQQMKDIHFDRSGTSEFNELNETLNLMSQKIYHDFLSMKEFTENAAHEMQTPIAVIQSKLEILLQEENLRHDQVRSVMEATESLSRLSKLNQGLLFLARIENNQYRADALVSFAEISQKYLALFGEQIREKQLTVSADFTTDFCVRIHSLLADSLVSNLIGNAIKYNFAGGSIHITSGNLVYTISNTGKGIALPKNKIFSRFSGSGDAVSTGLGLAIVKQIAESNKMEISYRENNSVHFFSITKKTSG